MYTWKSKYDAGGFEGLREKPRRPRTSPTRLPAEVEALACQMRRANPPLGRPADRLELAETSPATAPSCATVHRVIERNGPIRHQKQQHRRKCKRWQRETPMHLWQLDLVGGIFLADGRECKMLTGIDDHSRFVVTATVLAVPSGRAVADGFVRAMRTYGVPTTHDPTETEPTPLQMAPFGTPRLRRSLPTLRGRRFTSTLWTREHLPCVLTKSFARRCKRSRKRLRRSLKLPAPASNTSPAGHVTVPPGRLCQGPIPDRSIRGSRAREPRLWMLRG
ncbi:helix-turn-helix domain-containing protein [Streptomyces sp. 7R007]